MSAPDVGPKTCVHCRAKVLFVVAESRSPIALDYEPTLRGEYVVRRICDDDTIVVASASNRPAGVRYRAHAQSCPGPRRNGKPRAADRYPRVAR